MNFPNVKLSSKIKTFISTLILDETFAFKDIYNDIAKFNADV